MALSERHTQLLFAVVANLGNAEINFDIVAKQANYSSPKYARDEWAKIKKKIFEAAKVEGEGEGDNDAATAKKPTPRKRKQDDEGDADSPATKKPTPRGKGKKAKDSAAENGADEEVNMKAEIDADDTVEKSPAKAKTPPKKKAAPRGKGKKASAGESGDVENSKTEDDDEEISAGTKMPPKTSPKTSPKKKPSPAGKDKKAGADNDAAELTSSEDAEHADNNEVEGDEAKGKNSEQVLEEDEKLAAEKEKTEEVDAIGKGDNAEENNNGEEAAMVKVQETVADVEVAAAG